MKDKKEEHKHIYKKVSDKIIEVDETEAINEMFNLKIVENMGKIKQRVTVFKCECGGTQTFIDEPEGTWNDSLPKEFTIND